MISHPRLTLTLVDANFGVALAGSKAEVGILLATDAIQESKCAAVSVIHADRDALR